MNVLREIPAKPNTFEIVQIFGYSFLGMALARLLLSVLVYLCNLPILVTVLSFHNWFLISVSVVTSLIIIIGAGLAVKITFFGDVA